MELGGVGIEAVLIILLSEEVWIDESSGGDGARERNTP